MDRKPITVMYLIDTCLSLPGGQSQGGGEKQLFLLVSSLDPCAFRAIVAQLGPSDAGRVPVGTFGAATLLHVPVRRFYTLAGLVQLYQLCRLAQRERVDIIHTYFEKSEVMGWLISRLTGIPRWVTSRRDLGFKRKGIYRKIFRLAAADCLKCVAVCRAVGEQANAEEGLPAGKIEVIYNGMNSLPLQENPDAGGLKRAVGVHEASPLVGMVANMNFEIKGHRHFLQAAKLVLAQIPTVEFLLVGDGPLRDRFQAFAGELGVSGNVHFLGSRNDTPAILSVLDVSVLCSTSEGMSNVILESMAAGKPVVATRVGGNPELVLEGVTGLVTAPADPEALAAAILTLLRNPGAARAMGAAARELVAREFTVATMVRKHECLYRSMMDETSDPIFEENREHGVHP